MENNELRNARRRSRATGSRADSSDIRTPAQKDRDRLLYSSSLRRLAQVTQVISADVGHVFHNRLTHTLQVAQVGRRLAERLRSVYPDLVALSDGIDPEVVEAACYAHDMGHPPFGHIAELELNRLAGPEIDGFEGNAQSFRIVNNLSQHSPDYRGLNLTRATLAAILKYPWGYKENPNKEDKWGAYTSEKKDFEFARELRQPHLKRTLEADIMDWADDITYSVHDLDDFYRAHMIPLHLFSSRKYEQERNKFFEAIARRHPGESGPWSRRDLLESALNEIFGGLFNLTDPYGGSWKERASLRRFMSYLIGRYIGGTTLRECEGGCELYVDPNLKQEVAVLKEMTWVYVIEAPSLASQQYGQCQAIGKLFEIYRSAATDNREEGLKIFPPFYRSAIEEAGRDPNRIRRVVVDLIAGMTEAQALAMHNRLTGVSVGSGLDEIIR